MPANSPPEDLPMNRLLLPLLLCLSPAALAADVNGAVRLTHWGVIRASGDDALAFLHGQGLNRRQMNLANRISEQSNQRLDTRAVGVRLFGNSGVCFLDRP